jgi:hypothetical protein
MPEFTTVLHENGANVKVEGVFTDFTNVTRKGKIVKIEETDDLGPSDICIKHRLKCSRRTSRRPGKWLKLK